MTFKLTAAETGGALTLSLDQVPPGGGPPLHYHQNEEEIFIVKEGRISYRVGNRWSELGPGGVVFVPRNVPHCFRNPGATGAAHWTLLTPSGFETFFQRCGEEFAKPAGPDMDRVVEISAEHGIHYLEQPA